MKKFIPLLLIAVISFACSGNPAPERLPVTVKETLKLLNPNPQVVMYFNFDNMRKSNFWKENIGDTLFAAQSETSGIFDIVNKISGVTFSSGLNELYISNSWEGDNTLIIKGSFNKDSIFQNIKKDTSYAVLNTPSGKPVYALKEKNLYFFLWDNSTLAASNYYDRIEEITRITDTTSNAGINQNPELLNAIENSFYKSGMWLVSTDKYFIKETYMLMSEPSMDRSDLLNADSVFSKKLGKFDIILKNVTSSALSAKMDNELNLSVQFGFADEKSADESAKLLTSLISLSKLNSPDKDSPMKKIFEDAQIFPQKTYAILNFTINKKNLQVFRNAVPVMKN
jgi:hypothetical protein